LAVLEGVARSHGIPTRVRGLVVDGRFWYPRFPRVTFLVSSRVLLAWPEFQVMQGWISVGELFGGMAELAATGVGFTNAGGDTLFDYRGYRDQVLARAAELAVDPVLLGPVEHDELPALMAAASVFAFPSTKEGFGLAAMEALAAGVPVVLRDLPVLREVFGSSAHFAASPSALADALSAALASPDPARASAGVALARRHTWSAAAEAHLRLYREWREPA